MSLDSRRVRNCRTTACPGLHRHLAGAAAGRSVPPATSDRLPDDAEHARSDRRHTDQVWSAPEHGAAVFGCGAVRVQVAHVGSRQQLASSAPDRGYASRSITVVHRFPFVECGSAGPTSRPVVFQPTSLRAARLSASRAFSCLATSSRRWAGSSGSSTSAPRWRPEGSSGSGAPRPRFADGWPRVRECSRVPRAPRRRRRPPVPQTPRRARPGPCGPVASSPEALQVAAPPRNGSGRSPGAAAGRPPSSDQIQGFAGKRPPATPLPAVRPSSAAPPAPARGPPRRPPPAAAVENQAPGPRKRGNHMTSSSNLLNRPNPHNTSHTEAIPAP